MDTNRSAAPTAKTTCLRKLLLERGPLSPLEASSVLDQLAEMVDAAHHRGVAHGALCPENVFVAGDGRNDIEVFAWATQHGRGVAMGNSPADVLDAAGEITGSVQDASLAQVLATLT